MNKKVVGILGGMGPYTGFELARRICNISKCSNDQSHLSVVIVSFPSEVPDRSEFALTQKGLNPGKCALKSLNRLIDAGADVIGVACNTIHVPKCWNFLEQHAQERGVVLINLVDEVCSAIQLRLPPSACIGILGTNGTIKSGLYQSRLKKNGFNSVCLDERGLRLTQELIYSSEWGLKANGTPTPIARNIVNQLTLSLKARGASILLFACSELTFFSLDENFEPVFDSLTILAEALVRTAQS